MDKQTSYITLEQILDIHQDQIDKYGGKHGIRDFALMESAIFRPQTTFSGKDLYPTIFDKTAALLHSLILNHPFVDGNKRTGIMAALVFLGLNGYTLKVKQEELINLALGIESKKIDVSQVSKWLSDKIKASN